MKSRCIKINNTNIINYIISSLNKINNMNLLYSVKDFKKYTNIIIHCSNDYEIFLEDLSNIITDSIIIFYEKSIIKNLIDFDYFYFDDLEKLKIYNIATDFLSSDEFEDLDLSERYNEIWNCVYFYLNDNKSIVLNGFVNFRLSSYIRYLDTIVDISVNKYLVDKEYTQFISLLQAYVDSHNSKIELVHLIYNNTDSMLLDQNFNIIPLSGKISSAKYLSDISFSCNDYILNSLISLLPKKIDVHIIGYKDDFIGTLENIFKNKIHICSDCNICKTYKLIYKPNNFSKI